MANPMIQHPSQDFIQAGYNQIAVGPELDAYGDGKFLWGSGMNSADFDRLIYLNYRDKAMRNLMHTFMTFFGARSYPGYSQDHGWWEMGKFRKGLTVSSIVSGADTTEIVVKTGRDTIYHEVNDVLNSASGWSARITAVSLDASEEQVTLVRLDGGTFTAADLTVGTKLGHSHNNHAEASGQPKGRTWKPEFRSNQYGIVKRSAAFSGDALTQKVDLKVGDWEGWVPANQMITIEQFCEDRENMLMHSYPGQSSDTILSPWGILRSIEAGSQTFVGYTDSMSEADMNAAIENLAMLNDQQEYLLLLGTTAYFRFQSIFKDWAVDGSISFGEFSQKKGLAVGLNFRQYQLGGTRFTVAEYKGFNDTDVMGSPFGGVASAVDTDYKDFALILNLGTGSDLGKQEVGALGGGRIPMLSYKYKALGGVDRSMVVGIRPGMTGLTNHLNQNGIKDLGGPNKGNPQMTNMALGKTVSTDLDVDELYMLSQMSVRLVGVENNHGFMRRTA